MSLRILCVSNALWAGTGYGTQIHQLMRHLRAAGHQVALFANYGLGGSKIVADGFTIFPAALEAGGNDMIHGHADHWQADLVIILYDAFSMDGRILRRMSQHICIWQPVDCQPMGRPDLETFQLSGSQPIAMANFGKKMMEAEGLEPLYAPHGIYTKDIFTPVDQATRSALRADSSKEMKPIPDDAFVIGMNFHNKDADRKAVWEQMSAFALFHSKHPDTVLLAHTMPHPVMSGNNLLDMASYLGIDKCIRWANPYSLLGGDYTQSDIANVYRKMNLYSGASRGEGFGLPNIEAQACGVPVVTTDASAMTELAGPGYLVSGQPYWSKGHRATWITPDIGDLLDVYEDAYDGGAERRAADSRKFACEYDADLVYDRYWVPIMTQLEKAITEDPVEKAREDTGQWRLVK